MQLEHTFTVPVSVEEAFEVLTDIERVAPCMPGASLDEVEDEREFTGRVRVKVGPMEVSYRGTARFAEVDADGRRVVLEAQGRQEQGSGTADATVTASLTGNGEGTTVTVSTELKITGRPAQFGRGVMEDVGEKLLDEFADCLARELSGPPEEPGEAAAGPDEAGAEEVEAAVGRGAGEGRGEEAVAGEDRPVGAVDTGRMHRRRERPGSVALGDGRPGPADVPRQRRRAPGEPLDLLEFAGPSIAKRYGPAVLLLAVAALVLWWIRR